MTTPRDTRSVGAVCELQVTLLAVDPPVWRRVAVRSDLLLADLHHVIQAAMGWSDAHLHEFVTADGVRFAANDPAIDPDGRGPDVHAAQGVRLLDVLPQPGAALRYAYDFGDGWEHRVELLAVRPPGAGERTATCVAGERACPPEDCGGPGGYADLVAALADPAHARHPELVEWLAASTRAGFDPEVFDLAATNTHLQTLV